MLLGTVPYMAPEQLEGHGVDARTDIFAFGAIVYEMAAGRRAFAGDSQASLIAAILEREPEPISGDPPLTPPGLERLVRKCLAKDPDARWQSASDIADELRWLSTGSGGAAVSPAAVRRGPRFRRWTIAAAVLLLAGVAAFALWQRSQSGNRAGPRREARYTQATFAGDVLAAALSPDGRTVAYASGVQGRDVRVFIRDLTGGQSLEIWKGDLGEPELAAEWFAVARGPRSWSRVSLPVRRRFTADYSVGRVHSASPRWIAVRAFDADHRRF